MLVVERQLQQLLQPQVVGEGEREERQQLKRRKKEEKKEEEEEESDDDMGFW